LWQNIFLPVTQVAQKILAHFSGLSGLGYLIFRIWILFGIWVLGFGILFPLSENQIAFI
jgi:hypothetical protein